MGEECFNAPPPRSGGHQTSDTEGLQLALRVMAVERRIRGKKPL